MDLSAFPDVVQALLRDSPPMPLVSSRSPDDRIREVLDQASATRWFPDARSADGALAGLWLRFGGWDESHIIAQDLHSKEGSYWHGIIHRQEPDDWNSTYWFRQAGDHPICEKLRAAAEPLVAQHPEAGFSLKKTWDAPGFVTFCQKARDLPGSSAHDLAVALQEVEWWLLFEWCARATMK